MRFAITLLVALLAHEAHAGCESTRWIDDFSAGVPTHESVSPVEGSSATAVAHEELPNGDTRASFVASWQMQPPQIPSVISRVVMERGSTAPLTCWSGVALEVIQQALGHADVRSTARYARAAELSPVSVLQLVPDLSLAGKAARKDER